ncbi:MAG TPA: hypothetical protein VKP65_23930 [Rhodothermales bacterium]|nr:hypothetical protein [Rhodothermales bacterium]
MPLPASLLVCALLLVGLAACNDASAPRPDASPPEASDLTEMNHIAESYAKLVLAVGQHDEGYVDAYYGPDVWQAEADSAKKTLAQIKQEAQPLIAELQEMDTSGQDELVDLRHQYLLKQLHALVARVEMLEGETFSFDEEASALYDAEPPTYPARHFEEILARLDKKLPGEGPLIERYGAFKQDFIIPTEKLDTVFTAAIDEARRRTLDQIDLPPNENFVVEYVKDKPWSGYNWYQGNAQSLIQVNTDLPIYIDRAVDLAAHEGYPGHHVYNALLEKNLVDERGWMEFSVYPLFSPQSLIAEGSANYGIKVAFPAEERLAFEREVLFPLAGLDSSRVEEYYAVEELVSELSYAGNEAARRYLNGEIDAEEAAEWLATYAMMPMERARQRVRFIDTYRSYVINYNLGQDLVQRYVETRGGTADQPEQRWDIFSSLLSSPRLPSGLETNTP